MQMHFLNPESLKVRGEEYSQMLDVISRCLANQLESHAFSDFVSKATEAIVVTASPKKVIAFSLYESVVVNPQYATKWLPSETTAAYCSAVFVSPDYQTKGIGLSMVKRFLEDVSPSCFCTSSPLLGWLRANRILIERQGYRSFPVLRGKTPADAFEAAKIILKLTKRSDRQLTPELIRKNVYSEAEWRILNGAQRPNQTECLAVGDSMMLISFKLYL